MDKKEDDEMLNGEFEGENNDAISRSFSKGSRASHGSHNLSLSRSTRSANRSVREQPGSAKSERKDQDIEEGEKKYRTRTETSIFRLAAMNKPELPVFIIGTAGALGNGCTFPVFGLLLSNAIFSFYLPTPHEIRRKANFWALMYLILAIGILIVAPTQIFSFGLIGQRLIRRLRKKTFEKVLRNEIGWFDDDDNARWGCFKVLILKP